MKKVLLLFVSLCTLSLNAQTIFDFESSATSTSFQTFGGALEGQVNSPIANPDPNGINTSDSVMIYVKAGDAPTWGGAFANPGPAGGIDVTDGGLICMDVWMDHIGIWSLKLEKADPNDPDNYRQEIANTLSNTWERLCFDMDWTSLDGNMTPGTGKTFVGLVIFPDFGSTGGGTDVTYYFDNVSKETTAPMLVCDTLFDYENTSQTFQYFGSALDGQLTTTAANPVQVGINTSDSLMLYVKAGDAQTWAGAFSNPEIPGSIDCTVVREICVKVYWMQAGNLALKLELAAFDNPENWIRTVDVTIPNEWTEICFDLTLPSIEGNMNPAIGKVYPKIVLFPDFNIAGTGTDVNYYLDEFVTKSISTAATFDVTFNVNMNDYAGTFTQPYLSGSFNSWSPDANPMEDPDQDGVWTTTVNVSSGEIEYKFQLDQWTAEESFNGSDVCTKTTDDNGNLIVNRVLTVATDDTLSAVCYNSCYDCGESVKITWNLDMSDEIVSDDGVYVAGGPFFGHAELPAMTDTDGDSIYTTTLEREIGFETDYTFLNGICLPNWDCKENIGGQDCAVAPYNDRHLDPVLEDVSINTFFGSCEMFSSTKELKFDDNIIDVYPSLAIDHVIIQLNEASSDYLLNVYDVNGKFNIVNQKIQPNTDRIDVSNFAPGMYFIQVNNENKIAVKRIIVQ